VRSDARRAAGGHISAGAAENICACGCRIACWTKSPRLFPLWVADFAAWRWRAVVPRRMGPPLVFCATALWVGIEAFGGHHLPRLADSLRLPGNLSAYDYTIGVLVTLFIMGLTNSPLPVPGRAVQRLIRFLAGMTFGLYLIHFPLFNFFGTVIPGPVDGTVHRILIFGLTLGVAIALAHVIEQQKGPVLRSGLDLARRRFFRPAFRRQGPP